METQGNDPLRLLRRVRAVVMAWSVCAALFILFGPLPDIRQTVVTIHYLGLGTLFFFLIIGEICHGWILWLVHARDSRWPLIGTLTHLWRILTELMPGPAALIILSSGLRLLYEGYHSLRLTWLFVLVAGFGFFFADGLLGYTPTIARLHALGMRLDEAASRLELRSLVRSWSFNLMLLLHFASFAFLYVVGRCKFLAAFRPLYTAMTDLERFLYPFTGRLTGVVTALALIALEALIVLLIRRK